MDCSMPGSSDLRYLPEFAHINVHWDSVACCIILCYLLSFCLQSFPASGSFPETKLFASGGQSIEVLALASVLPINIQGCFPLQLTCLNLQYKGLSGVFSSITIWSFPVCSAYFVVQFLHLYMTTRKTIALTIQTSSRGLVPLHFLPLEWFHLHISLSNLVTVAFCMMCSA